MIRRLRPGKAGEGGEALFSAANFAGTRSHESVRNGRDLFCSLAGIKHSVDYGESLSPTLSHAPMLPKWPSSRISGRFGYTEPKNYA